MGRKTKQACGLNGGKSQKIPDPKDAISLLGRVMWTPSFGDSLPPCGMDIGDFAKQLGMKGVFFHFGIGNLKWIFRVPELGEAPSDGEAEKLVRFTESSKSRAIDSAILDESTNNPIRIGGYVHDRLRNGWSLIVRDFY